MQTTLTKILRSNLIGRRISKIDDDISVEGIIKDAVVVVGTINGVRITILQKNHPYSTIERLLPFDQCNILCLCDNKKDLEAR